MTIIAEVCVCVCVCVCVWGTALVPNHVLKRLRYNYNLSARISIRRYHRRKITEEASEENHSLTRKSVGYRNWRRRQWWCKNEGNKVMGKEK